MKSKNPFNSKNNKNKKETKAPQSSSPKKKQNYQRLPSELAQMRDLRFIGHSHSNLQGLTTAGPWGLTTN